MRAEGGGVWAQISLFQGGAGRLKLFDTSAGERGKCLRREFTGVWGPDKIEVYVYGLVAFVVRGTKYKAPQNPATGQNHPK